MQVEVNITEIQVELQQIPTQLKYLLISRKTILKDTAYRFN